MMLHTPAGAPTFNRASFMRTATTCHPRPLQGLQRVQRVRLVGHQCRAVQEFDLGRVFSGGKEANWLAPEDNSNSAKAVVLFMHGFAQGPNAYYKNLKGLADAGFLVVAPVPPFAPTPGQQQAAMVEYALHFLDKIYTNSLTGLPLPSGSVAKKVGLLGHSVGGGLETYVAQQAALKQQPFKAVMYMAPQTQVVDKYLPATAINSWPTKGKASTDFGLQYGLKDALAPPKLAEALQANLQDGHLEIKAEDVTCFPEGTHVGFEDQVVLGDAEVTSDILPWLNPLLLWLITTLGVPFLPGYLLGLAYKRRLATRQAPLLGKAADEEGKEAEMVAGAQVNPLDVALLLQQEVRRIKYEQQAHALKALAPPPDGIATPEKVKIASAEASVIQYVGLLAVTVAAFVALAKNTLDGVADGEIHWLSLLGTAVAGYFTYQGWYYLQLQNYVDNVQRPHSRAKAKAFMIKYLL